MYRLIKVLAVFVFNAIFTVAPATAETPWDSTQMQDWYPYCKTGVAGRNASPLNDAELTALGYCVGTVRSVAQVGGLLCSTDANTGIGSATQMANNQTLLMVVLNFYEKNVQYMSSLDLSSVTFLALVDAYPCD